MNVFKLSQINNGSEVCWPTF